MQSGRISLFTFVQNNSNKKRNCIFEKKVKKKFATLLSRRVSLNEPEANRHQYPEKAANSANNGWQLGRTPSWDPQPTS